MKKKRIIKLGNVEIYEVDKGIYMSNIDIDGLKHTTLTSDPMSGLDFLIKTKEEVCAGKMTTEDLIKEGGYIDISYSEDSDGFFQISARIMNREFILAMSDKHEAIRLLLELKSRPLNCLFDEYIFLAAREAIKKVKKYNK